MNGLRKNLKKLAVLAGCIVLAVSVLSGCGSGSEDAPGEKVKVVTTVFPLYDWTRNIAGEETNAAVSMINDSGTDLHSFQPSAADIMEISSCDVLIYIGGESEFWVDDALKSAKNKDMIIVNLMEILEDSLFTEELKEGMQGEEEAEGEEAEAEGPEADEHIWLSPKNAKTCCEAIRDALTAADRADREIYSENTEKYIAKLDELDAGYEKMASDASKDTLIFADRFPFRYLVEHYGLNYYAAFSGCSAESEAAFETVKFLADKINETDPGAVLTLENSDNGVAETVISAAGREGMPILSVNSMQSVTGDQASDGADYIEIMTENISAFASALK